MFDWFQRATFEAMADFDPLASALLAGFAEIIFGRVYLTAAGERYLAQRDGIEAAAALIEAAA